MPMHKVTEFLSGISRFFKKDNATHAMYTLMDLIKGIKMSETVLLGVKSKCDQPYSLLHVIQALLLYPCFMIRNPYKFDKSPLSDIPFAHLFNVTDEEIFDTVIYKSDELAHIC
ncbi:MAG: hypothetical protein LBH77_04890, partial [Tannerella sp.]|nr:hypothetical protein [Tannerella sp.]